MMKLKSSLHLIFYFLLFTTELSFPIVTFAQAPNSKLDDFLSGLETFSAGFEQKTFNDSGEEIEKSIGVFYMRRPGMLHWAYWEPYSQTIISDGVTLWIYDEDLQQVIIKDNSDSLGNSPAAVLGGNVVVDDYYVVINLGVTEGIDWLELTPRDVNAQYDSVRLGFQDGQLRKMLLFNNLGQKDQITFLDTKRNPSLGLKLFQFTPPEGVDIIDDRH